ncbi:MAG: hypothetical protein Kow0040_17360 [Thermogutta sp.]
MQFLRDRVRLRRSAEIVFAVGAALSGELRPEMFDALAEDEEEGRREYLRYQAHAALNRKHAPHAP